MISLSADGRTCKESISVNIDNGYDDLLRLLRFLGISHIHFHHLMGIPEQIKTLHLDLKCSYDVTIHDYFIINGNPSLTDKKMVSLLAIMLQTWTKYARKPTRCL